MAAKIAFSNPKHGSQAFHMFSEMRDLDEFCDIKLETNVDEISAHRVVLSACSPYFREAMNDVDTEDEAFVIPEEHDSKVVAAIVDYFYTGRLEIEKSLVSELLLTAHFFQARDILLKLEDVVVRQLTVENCLSYYSQAQEYGMTDLQKTIVRFIDWNFKEVVALDGWLELSAPNVCALVCNDVLSIEKEEDVYEALWKWLMHDENDRTSKCEKVFSNVRFFQLDPPFFKERVIPELFKGKEVCIDQIKQALVYQSSDKKKRQQMDAKLNPRYPSQIIYMFDNKASTVEKYDPITIDCVPETRILDGRETSSDQGFKAAIVVGKDLFLVSPTKVEKFNCLGLSWEKVAKGVNVREVALCSDTDCFYVIGGRDQPTAVKCFNVMTFTWSQLPDMPEGRRSGGAVAFDGRIYVMGGFGADEPLDTTLRFSNRSNKWKHLVKMNNQRFGQATIVIRNQIFVIGGRNNSGTFKSIETFDLKSSKEEWKQFPHDMTKPRNELGAVYYNGQLWCMGGRGENSIERFDFGTKTWELVGKLGNVRYGMSCVLYSALF